MGKEERPSKNLKWSGLPPSSPCALYSLVVTWGRADSMTTALPEQPRFVLSAGERAVGDIL
jgi:hypothetical protein